jgi:hypothetical protein
MAYEKYTGEVILTKGNRKYCEKICPSNNGVKRFEILAAVSMQIQLF